MITENTHLREASNGSNDVSGFVHDDDGARAQAGLGILEGVIIHAVVIR